MCYALRDLHARAARFSCCSGAGSCFSLQRILCVANSGFVQSVEQSVRCAPRTRAVQNAPRVGSTRLSAHRHLSATPSLPAHAHTCLALQTRERFWHAAFGALLLHRVSAWNRFLPLIRVDRFLRRSRSARCLLRCPAGARRMPAEPRRRVMACQLLSFCRVFRGHAINGDPSVLRCSHTTAYML